MSFELDCTLEQFVRRFFELHGAEMEKTPRGLEVLLPGELAQRLETPDYIHIQTGPEAAGEHAVNYGSPLLEKVVDAACETAPLLNCQLNFDYLKRQGFDKLIQFIAFISINLAIINLLPIPVLDGGHLLFFSIEAVKGRPVSVKVREVAQQVGLFFLILLMILVFYNDITRFFPL